MKTALEASAIVVAAYTAKRDGLLAELKELSENIGKLRSNSKDRPRLQDRLTRYTENALPHANKQLDEAIAAQSKAEAFATIDVQIAELCKLRNQLIPSQLLQCQLKSAMKDGFCSV